VVVVVVIRSMLVVVLFLGTLVLLAHPVPTDKANRNQACPQSVLVLVEGGGEWWWWWWF